MQSVPPPANRLVASFRSHQNYLSAFTHLAGFTSPDNVDSDVLGEIARKVIAAFPDSPGHRNYDGGELASCLNRAWGTETILSSGMRFDRDDSFLRIANAWGCVQAYYVGYAATQALVVASGQPRPTNHPKTQDQSITLWTNRRNGVAPFSFAAIEGSVLRKDPTAYRHGPNRNIHIGIHSWAKGTKHNAWDIAALALRTTREEAVDAAVQDARRQKIRQKSKTWTAEEEARLARGMSPRPTPTFKTAQLSNGEKEACEKAVRPHGLLDYLWRLRIKANYQEADMFTEGPEDDAGSAIVASSMVRLAAAIMMAHETRIAQILGKTVVIEMARNWAAKNSPDHSMGIGLRLPLLERLL